MGFLDKLLGRTKGTAGDVAEKAEPVVDKSEDAAGDAKEKLAGDDDDVARAADAADDTTGSGPTAA